MKRSALRSMLLLIALWLPIALHAQSTVYMASSTASIFDHSSNNLTDVGLNYSNATALRGISVSIDINSPNLQPTSVTLGSAIATPSNWSFDYQVTNAATGSSIEIILYGKTSADAISTGNYAQLFVIHYNVPDLALCNGALGGDVTTGTIAFTGVTSSRNDGLGTSAGVAIDGTRPNQVVTINNTSSRGDVDCNDRVDVLDLSKMINVLTKRTTFSQWQKNRADLAPWSSVWATPGTFFSDANNYGDNTVNVSDVVLVADAILAGTWPDGKALYGAGKDGDAAASSIRKSSSARDVMLTCDVSHDGVGVSMESRARVASLQIDLRIPDAPETVEAKLNQALAGRLVARARRSGDVVRVLVYSPNGEPIATENRWLLELPLAIADPSSVEIVEPVIAGDADGDALPVSFKVVNGASSVAAAESVVSVAPSPMSATGMVVLNLAQRQETSVSIVDATGREVMRLLEGALLEAGLHQIPVDASTLPAGMYVCRVDAGGSSSSRTMLVVR